MILFYISVRVAIATRTCAWLSRAHVYSIQIRVLAVVWACGSKKKGRKIDKYISVKAIRIILSLVSSEIQIYLSSR